MVNVYASRLRVTLPPLLLFFFACGCMVFHQSSLPTYMSEVTITPLSRNIFVDTENSEEASMDFSDKLYSVELQLSCIQDATENLIVSCKTLQVFTNSFLCHVEDVAYFRKPQPVVTLNWDAERKTLSISTENLGSSVEPLFFRQDLCVPDLFDTHQTLAIKGAWERGRRGGTQKASIINGRK